MNKLMYGGSLTALLVAMGIATPNLAQAADATADATATADAGAAAGAATTSEVIVTGTRQTGITAADSPAPVQVVGQNALTKTGAVDLATSLFSAVPSFNISATGGDMAALSIEAALRGLSPNDTLVLVDGKRRHDTANLGVDGGSPYSGSATVDLSFIPVASIDHVEVLTDGAAAQYGSDAIAGVVNVILKKGSEGGTLTATGGSFYSGQGATGAVAVNDGFALGDKGWLNATLEWRYHDYTYAGIGDFRFQNPNGSVLPGLPFPDSNVTKAQGFPYENRVNGDPNYYLYNLMYNFGYDVTPDIEIYGFGNASYRLAAHYENYRAPSKVSGNECGSPGCPFPATGPLNYPLPLGFDPLEQIKELDGSFTFGVRGKAADWNFDLATTYGEDYVGVYVIDSANAQLYPILQSQQTGPLVPQRNFYNGAFDGTQWVTTLDIDRSLDTGFMASPLNVALGFEYRRETFSLTPGEPSSYFGGGVQSFDGYTPLDQGSESRSNEGVYIDVAGDPIKNLHLDLAGRYEHYSDFGGALVGKLTGRYDFTPQFAIRGTVSNGFRAPTLAEEFYSGTNVSPTSAEVQLPPNSAAAQLAGFRPLQPEKSVNFSAGIVAHPMDHMQITLDGYDIEMKDRILVTGFIFGSFEGTTVSQGVLNAITARGVTLDSGLSYTGISLFTNAANTRTVGVELTFDYASDFGDLGHVDWTVGFNYNQTSFTSIKPLPAAVTSTNPVGIALGQGPGTPILSPIAATSLTNATPPEKAILQALWNLDKFSVNGRLSIYGPTSETEILNSNQQTFIEQIPTTAIFDLDFGYKVTRHLKLDIGANNLFNTFPPRAPTIDGKPADNGLVYNVPYAFSPWGINGGYYYGRIAFDW